MRMMSSHLLLDDHVMIGGGWSRSPFFGLSGKHCLHIKVIFELENAVVIFPPSVMAFGLPLLACLNLSLIWLMMWGLACC